MCTVIVKAARLPLFVTFPFPFHPLFHFSMTFPFPFCYTSLTLPIPFTFLDRANSWFFICTRFRLLSSQYISPVFHPTLLPIYVRHLFILPPFRGQCDLSFRDSCCCCCVQYQNISTCSCCGWDSPHYTEKHQEQIIRYLKRIWTFQHWCSKQKHSRKRDVANSITK